MSVRVAKRSRELGQGSPEGVKPSHEYSPGVVVHAARVPRAATRATRKVERGKMARGKSARGEEGKWKKWKGGKGEKEKEKKRDYGKRALSVLEL